MAGIPAGVQQALHLQDVPSEIASQDLIVVNAPVRMFMGYYLFMAASDGRPLPRIPALDSLARREL